MGTGTDLLPKTQNTWSFGWGEVVSKGDENMPSKRRSQACSRVHSHASDSLSKMEEFRAGGILCDVTLESRDGRSFEVHKVVLAACSPYFQAMFTNNMRESKQDRVKMDIDAKILAELVKFAYTSEIALRRMDEVKATLVAANMLLLNGVEKACVDFISKRINASNCVQIIELAEFLSSEVLTQNILQYMEKNFVDFTAHKGFLSLPVNYVMKLLASEDIKLYSGEAEVLQVALSWIQYDVANRKSMCVDVLKHVRLPLVEREILLDMIAPELDLLKESGCAELLEEVDTYQLHPEKRPSLQSQMRTQPRKTCPKQLYVVGGISVFDGGLLDQIDCFNLEDNEHWRSLPAHMSTVRESAAVVVLHGLIYVIGGVTHDTNLSSVECYNPQLKCWSGVASLNSGKGQISGALLDGYIYAIGGSDDDLRQGLKTVERYCADSNKWEDVPSMHIGRGALGVAALNGKLYACGGASFNFAFASVEMYNPQKDHWSRVASMKRPRAFHDVVALHGYLYALGGAEMQNGEVSNIQDSIERYCPHTDQWTLIKALHFPCWGVRAVLHQSQDGEDSVYFLGQFLESSGHGTFGKLTVSGDSFLLSSIPFHKPGFRIQAGLVILP